MKKIVPILLALLSFFGCKRSSSLLPSVSGKAGEVLVVIEKDDWDGALGDCIRTVLADEYPYLPLYEPRYTLTNVSHSGFIEMFQVHRNIVFFDINPQVQKTGVQLINDRWASPQCLIYVAAYTVDDALDLVLQNEDYIRTVIEQAERNRVINNSIRYEDREMAAQLRPVFGGSLHFPGGYKLRKLHHDFAWLQYDTKKSTQGVFIYRYPVDGNEMDVNRIIAKRNEVMKRNVAGPSDGSYMITADYWEPSLDYVKYKGRQFAEVHGQWEMEGDFMGGPFTSHVFYSPDGREVFVVEAWVYAPQSNKRQYLRQTESLLYTWEWESSKE